MSEEPLARHYPECGSTNDLARAWATDPADPAPHGARVSAGFQTQGRGRRGRTWDAPPGQNVLLSVVLRPAFPIADAWHLAFLAALAVSDVLIASDLAPRLKWPNDVLLDGGKVAGILVEAVSVPLPLAPPPSMVLGAGGASSHAAADADWAAAVGVGLNVNQDQFPAPELLLHPATSLRLATGHDWDVPAVARAVADALERRTAEREFQGWGPLWEAYRRRLAVGAALKRGPLDGPERATLIDVERDGSARVRRADGTFARWASVEGESRAENPPR